MKKLGNNYRLRIGDGVTPTEGFVEIKGQQDISVNRSAATIDTSTKDNFPYGTQAPGLRTLSLPFALIPDLPDAAGYGAVEAASISTDPVNYQIVDSANANEVVFECAMYITDWNTTFPQNDAVKATGTLVAAEAPTVDELA